MMEANANLTLEIKELKRSLVQVEEGSKQALEGARTEAAVARRYWEAQLSEAEQRRLREAAEVVAVHLRELKQA